MDLSKLKARKAEEYAGRLAAAGELLYDSQLPGVEKDGKCVCCRELVPLLVAIVEKQRQALAIISDTPDAGNVRRFSSVDCAAVARYAIVSCDELAGKWGKDAERGSDEGR